MIRIKVAFCIKNLAKGTEKVRQQLITDPDMDVVEYGCTSYCGICRNYHVAIVNGKPIQADTPEALLENIEDYIDNELIDQL
ncbi:MULTISPECIES: DUF1450 domain-containing protein [Gracilibacillus]|uniref:DUF1450 domain-containing protein n=2 Tax=Gracilibacillus TaxID=74385 RepID=A0ABY4GMY8_9BACI|nr:MULTISPECIES: DUF1450 domain-containing protein [Gracilibacillus]UOQ48145.1 DUF1450 domain-containing protein [Gracilibacillus caseinilyticus]UOQ85325.1 DUF1450 domain-containing protein [Gracilibacillus salinarum]